jgi:hypothetical protein
MLKELKAHAIQVSTKTEKALTTGFWFSIVFLVGAIVILVF